MSKEELIQKVESIQDLKKDYNILYEILEELNISFKKTNCMKCRRDYLNIAKEELGMIESAAENSDFNGKWVYLRDRSFVWTKIDGTKVKINSQTPEKDIEEFVKTHAGFYKKIENEN